MNWLSQMKMGKEKQLLKMKLTFLILLVCLMQVSASVFSQTKKLSLDLKGKRISEVLMEIERTTDFRFFYQREQIDVDRKVDLQVADKNIDDILSVLFNGISVSYRIMEDNLILLTAENSVVQQIKSVSGKVVNSEGEPIPGVTVVVKGSTQGTITDVNGIFNISNLPPNATISFSFVGMKSQEVTVNHQSIINMTLKEETLGINEVIVTALGITRIDKSLGYAVSKVDSEELTGDASSNWMNALSGKVAGLVIDNAGTGPGGSMRVTLRGDQSLNYGNNEALFIVDGVPISSGTTATSGGTNYANIDAPIDFGNGASDINPEDIESVSVLKGPAATALYGSRAANGAIVITTKSGRKDKGIGVTVNSSVAFEKAGYWPDFQTEYGAGSSIAKPYSFWTLSEDLAPNGIAVSRNYSRYAFGEKFDPNQYRYLYASKNWETGEYAKLPWVYADNWYTGFFNTGVTCDNTVTIDGNNGKGSSVRLSLTDSRNKWILPNTGYVKQNLSLSFSQEINKYIKVNAKINYYLKNSDNIPTSGYAAGSAMYELVWGQNVNDINKAWKAEYENGRFNLDNYESGGTNGMGLVYPSEDTYNPYRSMHEHLNTLDKDRVFGNIGLEVTLAKGLSLALRSGMDMNIEFRTQRKPKLASGYLFGFYREQTIRSYEMNHDFLLNYSSQAFNGRLKMSYALGGNNMTDNYAANSISLERIGIENFYSISNEASGFPAQPLATRRNKAVNSFYGFAQLSWDNYFFLDITGRNDWSSSLSKDNNSYFYPSVSMSLLLDKVFSLQDKTDWVDLLKLRASWANVGNDTSPFSLDQYYGQTDYTGGYILPGTIPDPDIRPENVESVEFGLEGKFFQNRIGFDVAVYSTSTTDQIISAKTDLISGASAMKINVGEIRNRGIEISARFAPIRSKNGFNWMFNFNWSRNWNMLVSLTDDWDLNQPLQTANGTTIGGRTYIYSFVGEEMHVIYGKDYQRAPEGAYYTNAEGKKVDVSGMALVDQKTGYPILDPNPETRIGKVNPDWRAGMAHTFVYRNFSLSMAFSGQWGGNTYSVTNFALSYQGKLKNSLAGRYNGLVHEGVNEITDNAGNVSYVANETVTKNIVDYYNKYVWVRDNTRNNTFDTSFLKLREVKLDYKVPQSLYKRVGFLQGVSVGAFATNLFCWTNFPQFDPETGSVNGSSIYKGIETMAFPLTRTYGINTKISF